MIRTYRPGDALVLPGSTDGLLGGYAGPVEYNYDTGAPEWKAAILVGIGETLVGEQCAMILPPSCVARRPRTMVRLPLSRPEARYRAACWLHERGHPCWAFLVPGPSSLPEWVATACLHASVLRVAAGMGPILGVLNPRNPGTFPPSRALFFGHVGPCGAEGDVSGWSYDGYFLLGPDTVGWAAGYALLDENNELRADVPGETP